MVVVLPAPFTPTTNTTHGFAEKAAGRRAAVEAGAHVLAQQRAHRLGPAFRDLAASGPEKLHGLLGRGHPEISGQERLFDGIEVGGIQGAPAAHQVLHRRVQDLAGARKAELEAVEEAHRSTDCTGRAAGVPHPTSPAPDSPRGELMLIAPRATSPPVLAAAPLDVLHFWRMSQTITVRLTKELADWLEQTAAETGVSQGKLVREQLERARAAASSQAFMRLAGAVRGPRDLSGRKGFTRP